MLNSGLGIRGSGSVRNIYESRTNTDVIIGRNLHMKNEKSGISSRSQIKQEGMTIRAPIGEQ
jgi:hypothetical protein